MASMMRNLQGKAVLSINDHPDIRRVFDGFAMHPINISYSIGGGHRQKPASELIITS